jgi:uncharacterized protein YceK
MVLLDDAEALDRWGITLGFKASCSRLSLPVSMLVNTQFFPFGVTRMGI